MSRLRRANFTATEKVAILREALLERRPVSELCERYRIQPSQFYQWQKRLFENGAAAFGAEAARTERSLTRQVDALQAKLSEKDGVIADISQEYVRLKKVLGAP
jgi:transposase-like protein